MKKTLVTAAAFLLLAADPSASQGEQRNKETDGIGRYQLSGSRPVTVLDTVTGRVWLVEDDKEEGYVLRRVCYRMPTGQLLPTPTEDRSSRDVTRYRSWCAGQP